MEREKLIKDIGKSERGESDDDFETNKLKRILGKCTITSNMALMIVCIVCSIVSGCSILANIVFLAATANHLVEFAVNQFEAGNKPSRSPPPLDKLGILNHTTTTTDDANLSSMSTLIYAFLPLVLIFCLTQSIAVHFVLFF